LDATDTIAVNSLVQEFFAQQSLKILPQAPFGDAVNQFVSKDDKHAIEMFVIDSLSTQVKGLLQLDEDAINEGLDAHIEDFRKVMEKSFATGQERQVQRKRRFKPKPSGWDSDLDGHWTARPEAIEELMGSLERSASRTQKQTQPTSGVTFSDDDVDMFDEPLAQPSKKPAAARTAAKRAATTKKAPAAKKAAPTKKAPARGRKKANPFIDSDEEEEADVVMEEDDFEEPPVAKAPPAKPARATRGAAKTKQTTLNFSQSQRPVRSTQSKSTQKAIEISDDEISDDAFEDMPTTRGKRR